MRDAVTARRKAEEAEQTLRKQAQRLQCANVELEQEITDRKQVKEKLRKLSRAVEQSPSSVVITDVQGKIEYVNPNLTRLTGYTLHDLIDKTPRVWKSGEIPEKTIKQLWDTIIAGKEWRGELLNKKKNGELYWEFASISPIFDDDGKITHFCRCQGEYYSAQAG